MKILVPIKRVIDYNLKVRVKADESDVDLSNTKMAMNPFCEIAVEEAVRLKESGAATEVTLVTIGGPEAQEQLRTALALGADNALLIEAEGPALEPLNVARLLAKVVEDQQPELVILGKQSIDGDNNQVGQMLAALTQRAQGTFISSIEAGDLASGKIQIQREVDGGLQTLSLSLPAVLTTDLRLNEPRYATLPNIMKAKRKPLKTLSADALGVEIQAHTRLLKVSTPPVRSAGQRVDSVDSLIQKLTDEAKVIA
jgi:electron transfer flavoprotein beta subunit